MADDPLKGHLDAHTPAAAGDPAASAELGGADPLDLLAGLPDGEGNDVLAQLAEFVAAPARARGRPQGAANRKTGEMIRYLAARGHRDPWMTLSMIQSADFEALCKVIGADTAKQRLAVLAIMRGAAADLMPFHHARQALKLDLKDEGNKRPLMVIGEMNVSFESSDGFMSAGIPPDAGRAEKAKEINGDPVRQKGRADGGDVSD